MSEDEGGNSLYFHSTQMQSRYEDSLDSETRTKQAKSKLLSFKNNSELKHIAIIDKPKPKPKPKPRKITTRKKNISLNSHIRQSFDTPIDKFSYFAGDQTKLDDFIKRIKKPEDINKTSTKLWTPSEWKYIVNSIKLKFPVLPKRYKMTLKAINKRMMLQSMNDEEDSPWSQACTQPSIQLSNEEIKWLYELDEEQMTGNSSFLEDEEKEEGEEQVGKFVMNLNVSEDETTVSDSQSEPGIIEEYRIIDKSILIPESRQPSFDPFQSLQFAKQQTVEVIESDDNVPIKSPVKSITMSSPIESPFKTPTKRSKQMLDSKPTSATKTHSPIKLVTQSFESPKQIIISSDDEETIYSTAKSSLSSHQDIVLSMPEVKSRTRRTLNTTRLQISNALKISSYEDKTVTVRKVSDNNRVVIDLEQEIPDSESSDEDFSIIEITREVIPKQEVDIDRSILQVPSSPIDQQTTTISPDISSLKATELSKKFKTWGLKPVQGKVKLLEILTNISHFINPIQLTTLTTQTDFQTCIFNKLTQLIKQDQIWYERILSYEPIRIDQLQLWLASQHYILESDILQTYCDVNSITTTNS